MDSTDNIVNILLDIEAHELRILTILHKIAQTSNPETYEVIREPLQKLIIDTLKHAGELNNRVDDLRRI